MVQKERKNWRVAGHELPKLYLENCVEFGNIPHSIIFAGPKNIGKLDMAIDFAHLILCGNKQVDCGKCFFCRKKTYDQGNIIVEMGEKVIGIDMVREWKEAFNKSDFGGDYRLMIVDQIQRMTKESINAFLKILEEPGKKIVFLLITNRLHTVLDTIVSRSVVLNFGQLDLESMKKNIGDETDFSERELINLSMGKLNTLQKISGVPKKKLIDNVYNFWKLVFSPVVTKKIYVEKLLAVNGALSRSMYFWEGCSRDLLLYKKMGKEKCWWQDEKLFKLYNKINIGETDLISFMDNLAEFRLRKDKGVNKKLWLVDLLVSLYI